MVTDTARTGFHGVVEQTSPYGFRLKGDAFGSRGNDGRAWLNWSKRQDLGFSPPQDLKPGDFVTGEYDQARGYVYDITVSLPAVPEGDPVVSAFRDRDDLRDKRIMAQSCLNIAISFYALLPESERNDVNLWSRVAEHAELAWQWVSDHAASD